MISCKRGTRWNDVIGETSWYRRGPRCSRPSPLSTVIDAPIAGPTLQQSLDPGNAFFWKSKEDVHRLSMGMAMAPISENLVEAALAVPGLDQAAGAFAGAVNAFIPGPVGLGGASKTHSTGRGWASLAPRDH